MGKSQFSFIIAHVFILLRREASCFDDNINGMESTVAGRQKYEAIVRDSKMPKYGICWSDALKNLEVGCKHLSDDIQHRLALKFANCFLLATGRQQYHCPDNFELSDCTKDMALEAYIAYNEHFTHTHNMCQFLQSQIWQEQTDSTINRLTDTSVEAIQKIEVSNALQNKVMQKQNESLQNQQIFIERGQELKRLLEDSSIDVHKLFEEFKDTTSEQRDLLFEVFDKLTGLQSLVLGEFTGFYSLLFYTISILISYMLTSTPRTSGSRFWLFLLMTCNIVVERFLAYSGASEPYDANGKPLDENVGYIYVNSSILN